MSILSRRISLRRRKSVSEQGILTACLIAPQAKEPADELVAKKKELDAQVEAKRKEAKEFEAKMRQLAGNVGNIVGKAVPVSATEVLALFLWSTQEFIVFRMTTKLFEHGSPLQNLTNLLRVPESCLIMKSCSVWTL
jgi:seryl-tRNA synthetase